MNKLEQAAQQILEALEGIGFVSDYWNEKVTALRDSLAEPELNLNCKSVQKRLATVWGYVKAEQAEQEPVIECDCETSISSDGSRLTKCGSDQMRRAVEQGHAFCKQQAEQEPVAWQGAEEWEPLAFQLCADENGEESCNELLWDGGVIPEPWGERWLKYEDEAKRMIEYVRKYAAHVRTKDLTDDEIYTLYSEPCSDREMIDFARAVIAADREKNNANNNS